MTQPAHDKHYRVARKPALKPSKGSDRPPHGGEVNPVSLCGLVHWNLHSAASKHKTHGMARRFWNDNANSVNIVAKGSAQ